MKKIVFGALAATTALIATPALAVDAYTVFNGVNGTGGFYYGSANGTTLTDYDSAAVGACFLPGGTCLYSSTAPEGVIPGVVKGGSFPTVNYSGTTLAMHPGSSLGAFASFEATTAGNYSYSLLLQSIGMDTGATSGPGVGYTLFTGGTFGSRTVLGSYLASSGALTGSVFLNAGERFGVVVDNNGNYGGDTTALTFSVAGVPEPAQWALMIGGFGMIGGAMRRRRTLVAA